MSGILIGARVNIPLQFQQGDTPSWIDHPYMDQSGKSYDASAYTLTYVFAGATVPLIIVAAAQGSDWLTSLTAAQTNGLTAGTYWWSATLSAASFSEEVAAGDIAIVASLANAAAGYDGRSLAVQKLANWQAAFDGLKSGKTLSYRIGEREMRYRDLPDILAAINYWKGEVLREQTKTSIAQGQGNPRKLYARFPGRGR